jgi:multicomponent Na+:H+ antiporter subunit G
VGIVFLFLTVPTGAHMISRSAHRMDVPLFGSAEWPDDEDDATEDGSS